MLICNIHITHMINKEILYDDDDDDAKDHSHRNELLIYVQDLYKCLQSI